MFGKKTTYIVIFIALLFSISLVKEIGSKITDNNEIPAITKNTVKDDNGGIVEAPNDEDVFDREDAGREVYLTNLEPFDEDSMHTWSDDIDNYGSEHISCFTQATWGKNVGYSEFYIEGKYKELEGLVYVENGARDLDENESEWDSCWVKIFGDDKLIYSKKGFAKKMQPEEFKIDITDVKFLRVELSGTYKDATGWPWPLIGLGDMVIR